MKSTAHDPALRQALMLSLGAAVSLGITRFAYGLLLPPLRDDLGWSYALAGAMNTSNAAGYLLGALLTPLLLRRTSAGSVMVWGSLAASVLMAVCGLFTDSTVWLVQRLAAGVASALVFVTGGLLAARLGAAHPARAGWLIGLYYGGTGLGISLSALVVPAAMAVAFGNAHAWAAAWVVLALACFVGYGGSAPGCRATRCPGAGGQHNQRRHRVAADEHVACGVVSFCVCIGGLRHVWCRLHRLHDLHRRLVA